MFLLGVLPDISVSADAPIVANEAMWIRAAFSSDGKRQWQGVLSVDQDGVLSRPQPLGMAADEPGSMWIQEGQLMIRQPSPRPSDGVDVLVTAPIDAMLSLWLAPADDPSQSFKVSIRLGDLVEKWIDKPLDDRGSRLLLRRAPRDSLRVTLQQSDILGKTVERDSTVYESGERFQCMVEPYRLPVADGTRVQIKAHLSAAGSEREIWSTKHDVTAGKAAPLLVDLQLPEEEGVYDLIIEARYHPGLQQAVRGPLHWNKVVARRHVQVVVLSDISPSQADELAKPESAETLSAVVEIDPANPKWHEKLGLDKLSVLPGMSRRRRGPLGNGQRDVWEHPLGKLVRLGPNAQSPDVSWEAYTLPLEHAGRPHILEVDYPNDEPQTIGFSILEPNSAGVLPPIGLDSGVDVRVDPLAVKTPQMISHRIVFWPRTTSPLLLITNRRQTRSAVYGKIRVLAGWDRLPQAAASEPLARSGQPERLWAAYLDRPLFPENFSARQQKDGFVGKSLDDWTTFHQGGTRLVEYLQYVGYNGLMLSVLADGSTIYPSKLLQPTPLHDTGMFLATASDPVRKDVLEMLFRLFDREGLQLIPSIEFAAPLPALEDQLRENPSADSGMQWVGPDGKTWRQTHSTRWGMGPHYNVLDPRVQEEMLRVVREVIARYGHHRSFSGLTIRLSGHGYAQLLGPEWGMDDATISRFESAQGLRVPGTGPDKYAQRAAFLNQRNRALWLEWRAVQLSRFHARIRDALVADRPGRRLYLAGVDLFAFANSKLKKQLRPSLPQTTTVADALLQVGINVKHYGDSKEIVLLRSQQIALDRPFRAPSVDLAMEQLPDFNTYFRAAEVPGSLLFHRPHELHIPSFDRESPIDVSYSWFATHAAPSGSENRRRFAHSLASLDSQVIVDGGEMLLLGQEDSMRQMIATYRQLPPVQFQTAGSARERDKSLPVTFRYATYANKTYVYAVNDAPFASRARIRLDLPADAAADVREVTGTKPVVLKSLMDGTMAWEVSLPAFGMAAIRVMRPAVKATRPEITPPVAVNGIMRQRIVDLSARIRLLRDPPALAALENPGFEAKLDEHGSPPGWTASTNVGVTIGLDKTLKHGGKQSIKMTTQGNWASLVSRPFTPQPTGRLAISVSLRTEDVNRQPSLRVGLEWKRHGQSDYQHKAVGRGTEYPLGEQWNQGYVIPFDDMPLDGVTDVRVRFDLSGPGKVWVDDVQLCDLRFADPERNELIKLITTADLMLEDGQLGPSLRMLDGYWPRYLERHVPLRPSIARRPQRPPNRTDDSPPRKTGLFDQVRDLLPKF